MIQRLLLLLKETDAVCLPMGHHRPKALWKRKGSRIKLQSVAVWRKLRKWKEVQFLGALIIFTSNLLVAISSPSSFFWLSSSTFSALASSLEQLHKINTMNNIANSISAAFSSWWLAHWLTVGVAVRICLIVYISPRLNSVIFWNVTERY